MPTMTGDQFNVLILIISVTVFAIIFAICNAAIECTRAKKYPR